jgi:recombination protein RecT
MTDLVVREERALTPAQQRTENIRSAMATRLPAILPNGMSPERFEAVTIQAIAKNPELMDCTPQSIIMAVLEAAQLGLEPTGSLSRAWLIPFKGEATLMIGYQGYVDLARRSGDVSKVWARVVYEGDEFSVEYGTHEGIHHVPMLETSDPTKITHVYAVALLRNGVTDFEPMTKAQVDGIRARSRSANKGPWVSDYAEMAKKTVVRRLVKRLPLTSEIMDAISRDDEREFASPPEHVESRTASVKASLQARLSGGQPAQDAPQQPEEAEVAVSSPPIVSAQQQPEPVASADGDDICGAMSSPDLGEVEICTLDAGHKLAHTSSTGTKFPNRTVR